MQRPIALVTGGAGFIGSHMVDLLLGQDYEVRVIDNLSGGHDKNLAHHSHDSRLKIEQIDICQLNPKNSIFKNIKYIFHFAAIGDIVPSIEHPIDYLKTNVMGTAQILECARAAQIKKMIYAASSSCYGLADTPTDESHPISLQYPYALSKYLGEQTAFHWQRVYGIPVNSIRIFNAYGTRVRTTGVYGAVFGVFLKQKLAGEPFTVIGDGTQKRDFIYVTDVARAFLSAAETERVGQIWNLGASNPQSINRLVELLEGEIEYIPKRPGEPDCTWADTSKINRDLNWHPQISFSEGVKKMIKEIDNWRNAPLWNKESIAGATATWFKYLGRADLKDESHVIETISS
jgi:UDP-glucose 4-epimerase